MNLDSAIYYWQKSMTTTGIDTVVFQKAIPFLGNVTMSSYTAPKIEKQIQEFKNKQYDSYANLLSEYFIFLLSSSDSLDLAINYLKKFVDAFDVSQKTTDPVIAHTALLALRIPLRNKSIPEAFNYYTSRLKIYLGRNDSTALSICYFSLSTFYRLTGLPDMTVYNLKKAISYLNKDDLLTKEPISGIYGYMNNMSVLGQLYLDLGEYHTAIEYSLIAKKIRIEKINQPNTSFLDCNIALAKIKLSELDSVDELLNGAISNASKENDFPSLVRAYEIKGQYFLALNQLDSVETSILKCKELMRIHNIRYFDAAGSHTPNYYLAKARLLQNRPEDARKLLEEEMPLISTIKLELLKEQKLLIEVYNKIGDSKASDSLFKEYTALQILIRDEDRKNRSMSFEIEEKITEAENTIKDLETEKKIADITKKYLIGIAALLLLVAIIIFNRFNVTRKQKVIIEKEKHRSEELLLNILPAEVAEELKTKGSADAKHFDQVTVLFTDFKGFTQISEKLSPGELVAEIDTCFKAFDNIIGNHNIEKIKTIGDAYMCAGGLPIANNTNAIDIVKAALEIQTFMFEHLQQRLKEGKEVFEIRIGIHTGPVVAGIVGVKKFAYDIWGDTVNIAARMESSGETGKVNISSSTYELVKDEFKCIYRGKVQAKHKGDIDMYFVEGMMQKV